HAGIRLGQRLERRRLEQRRRRLLRRRRKLRRRRRIRGLVATMQPCTDKERAAIEAAITRAEKTTSGEIVVVVAPASDGYYALALMWSALLALAVPLPLILLTKW